MAGCGDGKQNKKWNDTPRVCANGGKPFQHELKTKKKNNAADPFAKISISARLDVDKENR